MNKVNSSEQMIQAIVQVIEDYPERHTCGEFARTKSGMHCSPTAKEAYSFCVVGMMGRIDYEQGTNFTGTALTTLTKHCMDKTDISVARLNDTDINYLLDIMKSIK